MCGLTGILHFTERGNGTVQGMNNALAHRGPDAEGAWREGGIALGHRRLSIIDLSEAGRQPMLSADGRHVLIFNGEIYNFRELRSHLSYYPYRSHTDSEVLLAAYAHWGADCLSRLNGMFAFAIWDREKQELFLARDRMGIKPLYYYLDEQKLVFASEVRALLASGLVPRQLDQDALIDYLRYQTVQSPATILAGVRLLPPGHYLLATKENVAQHRYWNPIPEMQVPLSREQWKQQVFDTLQAAVERRLVADVPFGAFLSGGIDSSAVVALMSQVATEKIKTFSVTFAEEAFSEARFARMVAQKFNNQHHEIQLSPDDFLEALPSALDAMDHPSGDGPNTYVVSKATKAAGITMALSGLGGDELFAGYSIFRQSARLQGLQSLNLLPRFFRKGIGHALQLARPSVASAKMAGVLAAEKVSPLSAYPLFRQVLLDNQIQQLTGIRSLPENSAGQYLSALAEDENFHSLPLLSQVSLAEMGTYMQHVLLRDTDQMSMAHALEVRVPFLDHELVELALQIPDAVKYPHSPKQLLVESLGDLLPPEIVHRPKMGFTLPYRDWMKGPLRAFCGARLRQLAARPPFQEAYLLQLWEDFQQGKPTISWSRLWALVVLEHWLEKNKVE